MGGQRSTGASGAAWLGVATLLLVGLALVTPVNHDEDQYVAAAALTARGARPFVDFLYLQTPLQPWLLAPVAAIADGWSFVALRLVNAVAAAATLAFVYAAQRRAGVAARDALFATALCGSCVAFLFCASVARNDALPGLLLAVALWAAARGRGIDWLVAGVALGGAASIKISFGVPLAFGGLALALLWARAPSRGRAAAVVAWGVGGVVGLIPALVAWRTHPAAFGYGVFTYAAEAARIWYDLNGIGDRLSLAAKLRDTLAALAMGPALLALGVAVRRDARARDYARIVEALLVAGIVAALLPTPTYRQYLLPLLPPLFVSLGLSSERRRGARWLCYGLTGFGAAAVLVYAGLGVADTVRHGAPEPLRLTRQAHWIGAQVRGAGLSGDLATFSPSYVVDAGVPLDLRFATGVHVWRSGDLRSDAELAAFHALSRRTLAAELDRVPPAAILTGYEGSSGVNRRIVPDMALDAWARVHGYRRLTGLAGGVLWLRPG